MAADFTVRGDTRLDATGFNSGLKKLAGIAAKGLAVVAVSYTHLESIHPTRPRRARKEEGHIQGKGFDHV